MVTLQLKRKPLHYVINIIVPTLFITLTEFVVFLMPVSANKSEEIWNALFVNSSDWGIWEVENVAWMPSRLFIFQGGI